MLRVGVSSSSRILVSTYLAVGGPCSLRASRTFRFLRPTPLDSPLPSLSCFPLLAHPFPPRCLPPYDPDFACPTQIPFACLLPLLFPRFRSHPRHFCGPLCLDSTPNPLTSTLVLPSAHVLCASFNSWRGSCDSTHCRLTFEAQGMSSRISPVSGRRSARRSPFLLLDFSSVSARDTPFYLRTRRRTRRRISGGQRQ